MLEVEENIFGGNDCGELTLRVSESNALEFGVNCEMMEDLNFFVYTEKYI